MTTKQREGENPSEYITSKLILESHIGGDLILTKYINGMELCMPRRS